MHEWVPVSTSAKGRLVRAAVEAFGARPFGTVTVGELAAAADVTTGALYHHFGSKRRLYAVVHEDVERRLLDRMEGAIGAAGLAAGLLTGFDFAVGAGFPQLLGAAPAGGEPDRLAELLSAYTARVSPVLGWVLAAAWRAAVLAAGVDPGAARAALSALSVRYP